MARRAAASLGKRYEECRFVVAHLGTGVTIGAHEGGRIVDVIGAKGRRPVLRRARGRAAGRRSHRALLQRALDGSRAARQAALGLGLRRLPRHARPARDIRARLARRTRGARPRRIRLSGCERGSASSRGARREYRRSDTDRRHGALAGARRAHYEKDKIPRPRRRVAWRERT